MEYRLSNGIGNDDICNLLRINKSICDVLEAGSMRFAIQMSGFLSQAAGRWLLEWGSVYNHLMSSNKAQHHRKNLVQTFMKLSYALVEN